MTTPFLELAGISRSFGQTIALRSADLRFFAGRVAAVVGENGAGKTTAMRIAAGFLTADAGRILLDGREVRFSSSRQAAAAGIQMVHQHFMLVNQLTVAENIALVSPPGSSGIAGRFGYLDRASLEDNAAAALRVTGITLDRLDRRVGDLSVGERAKLELIKALIRKPRLLILDEPTSVLAPAETEELGRVVRRLAEDGVAVVVVTHKLPDVFQLAEVVHVMREGRVVLEEKTALSSPAGLAQAMVGELATAVERRPRAPGEVILQCRRLSTAGLRGIGLRQIDLEIRKAEISAVVGVAGNGQLELAELMRGLIAPVEGTIDLRGSSAGPEDLARELHIAHVPADRTREGIVGEMSIAENVALADPAKRLRNAPALAARLIGEYSIRARSPLQAVGTLSGGNQQKVVLARELEREPQLIVASEPTRGLDLESTAFVHDRLRAAAAGGAGVLLITSDLEEAFGLSDSLYVLYRGRLSRRISPSEGENVVAKLMAGLAW